MFDNGHFQKKHKRKLMCFDVYATNTKFAKTFYIHDLQAKQTY